MICPKCKGKLKKGAERCRQCGRKIGDMLETIGKSTIGMDENVAAASSYAFMFLSGLLFLLIERKSAFVRFHALQGTIALFITFTLNILAAFVPEYGLLLAVLLWVFNLFLIATLFIKAMSGEWFALPVVGNLSRRLFRPQAASPVK